jgi:hypothetical protein
MCETWQLVKLASLACSWLPLLLHSACKLLLLLLLQEPDIQEHIRCMRVVGLSALQQQQVADSFQVFSRLMEPVMTVRGGRPSHSHALAILPSMHAYGIRQCSG